ncbi:translocation/assembly module TamB [Flavihumibacter sp. R14]|nr:translocation/assembly module TamB [Flavihumibacter soli]
MVLLSYLLIQVPAVQNFARKKVVSFLENKIKTKVEINKLSLDLPKLLVLEDIYFEDQNRDTLLAGDTLKVDISLLKLLSNQVEINEIDLRGIRANVNRTMPDSTFNFDYIINAFMGEQKQAAPPADSSAAMKFSIDKINLDRIRIDFKDAVTSNDVSFALGHFDTRIQEFDLDKMKFSVPRVVVQNVNAKIIQSEPPLKNESAAKIEADSNEPLNMDLKLGTIDLSRINIDYQNTVSSIKSKVNFDKLLAEFDLIDLKNQKIAFKNISLENSSSIIALGKSPQAQVAVEEVGQEVEAQLNNNWKVTVSSLDLRNNKLMFDDFNMPVQKRGIDYGHMALSDFNLQSSRFFYSLDSISGDIANANFHDKSGFKLDELRTNFRYTDQGATLEDLYIKTPGTILRDYVSISYPSLEAITKNPGLIKVNANLIKSRLSFRDILLLAPQMAGMDPFKRSPNAILNINASVSGSVSDLNIPQMEISGLGNTRIAASGRITGLPDMNKATFNIKLREFNSGSADLASLLSPGMIPTNIRLPKNFNLSGTFNGGMSDFTTNLLLRSDYGTAKATGGMSSGSHKGSEKFNGTVELINFNAGRLLKQDSLMGRINARAKVNGTGLDPKSMSARFSAVASSAELKGYTYRNLTVNGNIRKQNVKAIARMADRNLRFNLDLDANIRNEFPAVNLTLDVDSMNLQKLNLYGSDLRFRGKIVANMPSTNPDRLIGSIEASNLLIASNGRRYQLDSINVNATVNGDEKDLRIRSEFISANLTGNYNLTEVRNGITNEINKYFKIGDGRPLPVSKPQNFNFAVDIQHRPVLQELVPLLTTLEPVNIQGSFNSEAGGLTLKGTAPNVVYAGNTTSNLKMDINSGSEALLYNVSLDKITTSAINVNKTSINGRVQNNQLDINLNVKDAAEKDKYSLAGLFAIKGQQYQFSFRTGGLMLNYHQWTVAPGNFIEFGPEGILASNFSLSRSGQTIAVNSNPQQPNAPMSLDFTNFRIGTLTAIAEQDSLLADGTINGNVLVSNLASSPTVVGDLTIKDFTFRADTVGDINLKVNNREANTYAANVIITGKGNDIRLDGEYFVRPENKSSFDFDLDVNNLNLASIEGLTMGNMKDASGNINGRLNITGTPDNPAIRGDLNFNAAAFNVAMLNSYYRIEQEKISFTSEGISFDKFTLTDSIGNDAVVDGTVLTSNYLDYRFNLDVNTDNFKVLSSTKKDNDLFYGTVFLNSDLRIRGDMNNPVIDGGLKINKGTDFTFVLPQSDPGVVEREGIVQFVDMDDPKSLTALTSGLDTLNTTPFKGMDVAVNIEVDSNAIFNIIIDEGNGDFLELQGEAELTAGIDPSGKTNLTGNFAAVKGAYELSFNFLKRRFEIERGSTINWQGEPTSADVDVTAVYVANTAPYDLVESQLSESPSTLNRYKQKLPFQVALNMKGELMKPDITFDISLPNRNYNVARDVVDNVQSQLTQLRAEPSELNKQVFALILLNRFVAENPFESGAGGGGVESIARSSVSKILSEQLNNLTENLIAGVDLNFDLVSSEDYTSGSLQNRTDLNVGVSKQLLNDRLKVSVGSDFELEGPRNTNQSKSSNVAGNIALDYQLSRDGRYMLRGYRKNEYEAEVEGYLIETGLGFIFTLDYNHFREILARKPEEERQRRKTEKENRKQEKREQKQSFNMEN